MPALHALFHQITIKRVSASVECVYSAHNGSCWAAPHGNTQILNKSIAALLFAILITNVYTLPGTADDNLSVAVPAPDHGDSRTSFPDKPVNETSNSIHSPQVALALGGGGVRGSAHIGVLRVLEQEGIPIDYIVGNSMGAVVGGLHNAGVPLDNIQSILSDGSFVSAYLPRFLWCRIMLTPIQSVLHINRTRPYAGLVSGARLKSVIDDLLPNPNIRVEDLKCPFSSIAVNLIDGQAHVLSKGRVDDVIRASATLPLLVRPVRIGNDLYVDGGIRHNLPTTEARRSGAKLVISVEIDNDLTPVPAEQFKSFRKVFDRVMNATIEQLDEDQINGADVVIRPELVNIPILSKDKKFVDQATQAGEVAARNALPRIREMLRQSGLATRSTTTNLEIATPRNPQALNNL